MFDRLISPIAPHLCCGCGKIGTLLCDYCKYDIVDDTSCGCILCSNNHYDDVICVLCRKVVQRGWCVGSRTGALRKLIDDYKFENMKAVSRVLAELLHERIEQLPKATSVVPIPTISAHIRQRGYDHTALIARSFARRRGLKYQPVVKRATNTSQRDAPRLVRLARAKQAFMVPKSLSPNQPYLLIDDIATTGATLRYAATALRNAGAREVWVAVVARQTLD